MAPRFKRRQPSSSQVSNTRSTAGSTSTRTLQRGRFRRSRRPSTCSRSTAASTRRPQPPVPPYDPEASYHRSPGSSIRHPQSRCDEDESLGETVDTVVMAIDRHQKSAIGAAYYIAREEKLYCLQDVTNGDLDVLETVKVEIQPTVILLSPRVDPDSNGSEAAAFLRCSSLVDDGDEPPLPYRVDIRPSQEFAFEAAKTKLVNLETFAPSENATSFVIPGNASTGQNERDRESLGSTHRQGRFLRLSSQIDFDNRVGIGCTGAILTHLQRQRASAYLPGDPEAQHAYLVRGLEMDWYRFVNPDTLLSLQIIQPESHPNAFNQGPGSNGSKESLSLYGLFHHYARTPQGKARLKQCFLRPCLDLQVIQGRHETVGVLVRPENQVALQKLSKSMAKVKNIRTVMTHLHKGINGGNQKYGGFKSGVWPTLLEFAYHIMDIRDTLGEIHGGSQLPLMAKARDVLDARLLQAVGTNVHDIVDLDSSIEQNRTSVKRGVNDQLDNIKNVYDGMDDLLSRTALDIARTLPDHVASSLNVIYFPQLGYHITLPLDPQTRQPLFDGNMDHGANNGSRWERMFTTENQVYFKDARMREMDTMLGDLWNMICDLEIEIAYDLAQRVLGYEKPLVAISDLCGELDCLFALAQGAIQYKLVRPTMTEENIIDIKDCRHLLQEMTVPSYVSNDAYLVGGQGSGEEEGQDLSPAWRRPSSTTISSSDRACTSSDPAMLILTGPNYSGKSIYLKSVAHAVYLAHVGSFVPCSYSPSNSDEQSENHANHEEYESASRPPTIGITDAILTRIRTCETVSKARSAFMIDLQQVTQALRIATRRSLLVIDEFGKGTESADGAGLAAGLFTHLLDRGHSADTPKVLAATHFHEIFEMGYLSSDRYPNLAFGHLQVRVDREQHQHHSHNGNRPASNSQADISVTYLYTLHPGRSTTSFGTQCALLNGIPRPIVQRATLLADLVARGEDIVELCAGKMSHGEEEELLMAEDIGRKFLMWDLDADGDGSDSRRSTSSSRDEDVKRRLEQLLDVSRGGGSHSDDEDEDNDESGRIDDSKSALTTLPVPSTEMEGLTTGFQSISRSRSRSGSGSRSIVEISSDSDQLSASEMYEEMNSQTVTATETETGTETAAETTVATQSPLLLSRSSCVDVE